jgi:NAD(P)-dependent dehydrogenase (short-subunit alcohol dehydrogenase family)
MPIKTLSGQTAIVTGASRGIGKAIALLFAENGANVLATGRDVAALKECVAEIEATGGTATSFAADLGVDESIDRIVGAAMNAYGGVDLLINNAGIVTPPMDLVDHDPAYWRMVLNINLVVPALLTRAVLPIMIERGFGKIVNISSIGGRLAGPSRSAYRAAKVGLQSLTESTAAEVKQHGIDVNSICPGAVDTEGMRLGFGKAAEQMPLMPARDIARVALFLVSPDSAALTGATIDAFGWTNPIFARRSADDA